MMQSADISNSIHLSGRWKKPCIARQDTLFYTARSPILHDKKPCITPQESLLCTARSPALRRKKPLVRPQENAKRGCSDGRGILALRLWMVFRRRFQTASAVPNDVVACRIVALVFIVVDVIQLEFFLIVHLGLHFHGFSSCLLVS